MTFTIAVVVSFILLANPILANTEIINFSVDSSPSPPSFLSHSSLDFLAQHTADWPVLSPATYERQWLVDPAPVHTPLESVCAPPVHAAAVDDGRPTPPPCPYEAWAVLDLDEPTWNSYAKFTLRVSWPASSPADFSIQVYTPTELASHIGLLASLPSPSAPASPPPTTRLRFARIRLVSTGVRARTHAPLMPPPPPPAVAFITILEPLYFTVLPASVAPTVAFLVLVGAAAAAFVAPRVVSALEGVAATARAEVDQMRDDEVRSVRKEE